MKKGIVSFCLVCLASALVSYAKALPKDLGKKDCVQIDHIMAIKNIPEAQISPDGRHIAYVISQANLEKNGYDSDIWIVATDGGRRFKLTNGPGRDDRPRWSPDGSTIAFLSDRLGKSQIWLIPPFGGEARTLTRFDSGVYSFSWSSDGTKIACLQPDPKTVEERKVQKDSGDIICVDQDMKMNHVHIIDVSTGKTRKLTKGEFSVDSLSWSPDGEAIVFSARPSPKISDMFNADIYTVSLKDGFIQKIVERDGADASPVWSPDGKSIAFVSMDGRLEWIANWYICVVSAEGGKIQNISQRFDGFITSCTWSADSQSLYFPGNKGVTTQLFTVAVENGELKQMTSGLRVYRNFSFSGARDMVAFLVSESTTPAEVYVSAMQSFEPRRLTRTNPHLDSLLLGNTEVIQWQSFDGLDIEGLLIKPVGFEPGKRYPLLTYVHGGPSAKFGKSFSPQIGGSSPVQGESYPLHVLAGEGFAILLPNPRGSYGYGEQFRMANVGDWGGGDYRDIMAGVDHVIEMGIADPGRLGIMGRSYGGYMTSWIITQTSRFKAASLGAGMANLISFYGQTDIPGYMEYYFKGSPWTTREEYEKRSPITHAMNVQTPTLIEHGERDARVPLPQAREFYRALKKKGVPVEFIIYPRQGHSVREPLFQRDMMRRNLRWFIRWLKSPLSDTNRDF